MKYLHLAQHAGGLGFPQGSVSGQFITGRVLTAAFQQNQLPGSGHLSQRSFPLSLVQARLAQHVANRGNSKRHGRLQQDLARCAFRQRLEACDDCRVITFVPTLRVGIEHNAAPKRFSG